MCVCVCVCVFGIFCSYSHTFKPCLVMRINSDNLDLRLYFIVIKVISSYVVRKIVNSSFYPSVFRICFAGSKGTITSRRFF